MSLRRKLLGLFAVTVLASVGAVTWVASSMTGRAFERADRERSSALVAQFHREFDRQGEEITHRIESIVAGDAANRMAAAVGRGQPDFGAYLNDARDAASVHRLDFLEFLDARGAIISSAQSPAKFGYKETLPSSPLPKGAFLRQEVLADAPALCLCVARQLNSGDAALYVVGGKHLDAEFLTALDLPAGTHAMVYQSLAGEFSPQALLGVPAQDEVPGLEPIISRVRKTQKESSAILPQTSIGGDEEMVEAIPLDGDNGQMLGILLVASTRRAYVQLRQHMASTALIAAIAGLVLAAIFSQWAAGRVTRPVEQLVTAARDVAGGNWNAYVPVTSADEIGQLADAFNHMTHEMLQQRDRLVQSERVAAWRELARRLAHELKNPLFPLQLTVENLVRARGQSPEQFEEIFHESTATLLSEIANLKKIISRFSEFSRMPQPQLQLLQVNDVVRNVARLFQAQMEGENRPAIACELQLGEGMDPVSGDPDLLYKALSNLVLNAIDAMPSGGTLTLRTRLDKAHVVVEVTDTGAGISPEESAKLFTPYYTSKPHGTGLGLAVAQSIVSDHHGKITMHSEPGAGTTFVIELPRTDTTVVS